MYNQQDAMFEYNQADRWRTININNCCVSLTQFDIQSDEESKSYKKLINSGQETARDYLANYNPPTVSQLAKIKRIMGKLWPL